MRYSRKLQAPVEPSPFHTHPILVPPPSHERQVVFSTTASTIVGAAETYVQSYPYFVVRGAAPWWTKHEDADADADAPYIIA